MKRSQVKRYAAYESVTYPYTEAWITGISAGPDREEYVHLQLEPQGSRGTMAIESFMRQYHPLKRSRRNPNGQVVPFRSTRHAKRQIDEVAREVREIERRLSPTQSIAARRARHYGGVGYYKTVRDVAREFRTGDLVLVRFGKTTGKPCFDERVWRVVSSKGLEPVDGTVPWSMYVRQMKAICGRSPAILGVRRA